MASIYTAIIQRSQGWWIGWIEEIPGANAQGRTKESLLASLKELLKEPLEMHRADALANAQEGDIQWRRGHGTTPTG